MSIRFYADEFRAAIYEEAPGGGDPLDPNSLMNRPILNPSAWVANVFFHSNFDYYSTVVFQPSVTVAHPAVGSPSTYITPFITINGTISQTTHPLVTHGLGYVPRFFVVYQGRMIPHGTPSQVVSNTVVRFVSAYATTSEIRLFETGITGSVGLPAINLNYGVMVFRNSAADPLLDRLRIEPGNVVFGQGKFSMQWPHLRAVASGESPFAQALGRTAAIDNGAVRVWEPNGGPIDFGVYQGSFVSGPGFVNLQTGF